MRFKIKVSLALIIFFLIAEWHTCASPSAIIYQKADTANLNTFRTSVGKVLYPEKTLREDQGIKEYEAFASKIEEIDQKYFLIHSAGYKKNVIKRIAAGIFLSILLILTVIAIMNMNIKRLKKKLMKTNSELREQSNFLDSIVKNASIMIAIWDVSGRLVKFNKYAEMRTGFSESELIGKKWYTVVIPVNTRMEMIGVFKKIKNGELIENHESSIMCRDGSMIDVLWNNSLVYDESGTLQLVISTGVDITERKKTERKLVESYEILEATYEELSATEEELKNNYNELRRSQDALKVNEERYRLAIEGTNDALWDLDLENNKLYISARGRNMIGCSDEEEISTNEWIELIHHDDKAKYLQYMQGFFLGKTQSSQVEYRINSRKDGMKWVLCRAKGIWNEDGKLVRITGSYTDITERKKAEEEIHKLAYFDVLTGLPNRTLFLNRLDMALTEASKSKQKGAVFYLDVDNFKTVNDTLGHIFGDQMIKEVARRMKSCIRESDTVARIGGDEFVILQPGIKDIDDARKTAENILEKVQQTWVIKNMEFHITCSIGITVYPNDTKDSASLLKNADTAMYKAKELGKNNYQMYDHSMNERILERIELENDLRRAAERGELMLFYQPQVDTVSGNFVGTEALLRWSHKTAGLIPPAKFISVAEESGLIISIGEWVLRTACMQNVRWRNQGIEKMYIAVNLSAKQFQQKDLACKIQQILEETGMEPELLELEITETIAMRDIYHTVSVLKSLRSMGIKISLDDFGTGYSSLNHLKDLPINTLKIDKHFVKEINNSSCEEAITKAVISMAHSMMLDVIAEGVETKEQLDFLKEQRCDKVQGYLFSKPLPAEELEPILKKNGDASA